MTIVDEKKTYRFGEVDSSRMTDDTNPHAGPKPIPRPPPQEQVICSCGKIMTTPVVISPLPAGADRMPPLKQRVVPRACKSCKIMHGDRPVEPKPYVPPPIRNDERLMDRLERRNLDSTNYRLTGRQSLRRIRHAFAHAIDVSLFTLHRYFEPLPESLRYQFHENVWEKMDRAAHRARIGIVAKVRGE